MPADPQRVKAIFLGAAEWPDDAARDAYLDRACGGDAGLRDRVEALLRSHDPAGSFLGTPAVALPDPDRGEESDGLPFLTPSARPDALGQLGHYAVLEVHGRGDFGIVLRALDAVLHRVVAVKVLAPPLAATSPPPASGSCARPGRRPGSGTKTSSRCTRSRSSRCRTW